MPLPSTRTSYTVSEPTARCAAAGRHSATSDVPRSTCDPVAVDHEPTLSMSRVVPTRAASASSTVTVESFDAA